MQHLTSVSSGGKDRVIPEHLRVPIGRALLQAAAHLTYETVHIDHQPPLARTGARPPRSHQRLPEQRIELTHMPKRERPQKRPQRRGRRHPAAQQPPRPARPQRVAVVDAVRTQHHREQQCHHLPPRVRGPRPVASQAHQPPRQRLDPQPPRERRDQHHSSVRNGPLIVKLDPQTVESDRLVIMHHEGDLLSAGPGCANQPLKPCTGGHSSLPLGRNRPINPVDPGLGIEPRPLPSVCSECYAADRCRFSIRAAATLLALSAL